MKKTLIEYTLRETASIEDLERHIAVFVAGIRGLAMDIHYASHRKQGTARAYAHLASIPNEAALAALQRAPFFEAFADYLRCACEEPPRVTWLEPVASTP
jgi:hypothetical protein